MALLDPALYPHLQSYSQSRQPSSSLPNSSLRTNQTSRLQSVSSSVTSPASPSRASSSTASTPLSSPVQSNSSRCRNPSSPNKVTSVLSPVSSCPSPSSLSNGKARKNKKDEQHEVQEIVCLVKSSSVSEKFKEGLREKFKIFSQFQSAMNQEQVLDSLKREKDLKMKIKELIRCRKNGLKKLSDIPAFDAVRAKRGKKKENKKKVGITVSDLKDPVESMDLKEGKAKKRRKETNQSKSMESPTELKERRSPKETCLTRNSLNTSTRSTATPMASSMEVSRNRRPSPSLSMESLLVVRQKDSKTTSV